MNVLAAIPEDGWDVVECHGPEEFRARHVDMPEGAYVSVARWRVEDATGGRWRLGRRPSSLDIRSAVIELARQYIASTAARRFLPGGAR